jgi:predicted N-acetyltransferase YhbS
MEIRTARRSERDEVLDLLRLWYGDREFFALYNQNDPRFRDELCLVARDGGELVSTVQIFDRRINLGGQAVPMGGIGSVFTREDYRHKRVASALMRLAVETMEREGFEVSLLFAERLTFYNQFGWREVERKFSMLPQAAAIRAQAAYEIAAFESERDLAQVASIHRAYSGRINVTAVRDENDWRASLVFAGNREMHPGEESKEYFVLAREAGRAAAYARVTNLGGIGMVMEYGYVAGAEDAMLALLRYLGEAVSGAPVSFRLTGDHRRAALFRSGSGVTAPSGILVSHTAHDPVLEKRLAEAGCPVVYHPDNHYMWRVMAPDKLARRFDLAPERASAMAFEMFADDRSLYWTSDRF